jgi:hypothetical protein
MFNNLSSFFFLENSLSPIYFNESVDEPGLLGGEEPGGEEPGDDLLLQCSS